MSPWNFKKFPTLFHWPPWKSINFFPIFGIVPGIPSIVFLLYPSGISIKNPGYRSFSRRAQWLCLFLAQSLQKFKINARYWKLVFWINIQENIINYYAPEWRVTPNAFYPIYKSWQKYETCVVYILNVLKGTIVKALLLAFMPSCTILVTFFFVLIYLIAVTNICLEPTYLKQVLQALKDDTINVNVFQLLLVTLKEQWMGWALLLSYTCKNLNFDITSQGQIQKYSEVGLDKLYIKVAPPWFVAKSKMLWFSAKSWPTSVSYSD